MTIVGYQSWIRYRLTLLYWYLLTTELRLRGSLPVRGTRGVGLHVDARSSGDRYSRGPAASFRALFHYGWNSRLTESIIIFLSHSLSPISCYPRTNAPYLPQLKSPIWCQVGVDIGLERHHPGPRIPSKHMEASFISI